MSFKFVSPVILLSLFYSCTTIQETIFIQNVEVSSPIHQASIHVTDSTKHGVTISTKFSVATTSNISGKIDGHTKVNDSGFFQIDTTVNDDGSLTFRETPEVNNNDYKGKNLFWNITKVMASIDIDVPISYQAAFFGGVNFTSQNNSTYVGGTVGFGLFEAGKNYGYRLDGGVYWQTIFFDAQTIVSKEVSQPYSTDNYLLFFHDRRNLTHIDPFFSITYNTAYDNWPINFIVNAGYFRQTLIDFQPVSKIDSPYPFTIRTLKEDTRGSFSTNFIHLMPGVFFDFGKSGRLVMGVNFYFNSDSADLSRSAIILPYIQADFGF